MKQRNRLAGLVLTLTVASALSGRASDSKSIVDTEARRTTAENSVKTLKPRTATDGVQAMGAYKAAADANNAWLDLVLEAIHSGSARPDTTTLADSAATTLLAWV